MTLHADAQNLLESTSRTFFIPIMTLPDSLQAAVGSAYLCFRAIDEIEDHPDLDNHKKVGLLRDVSHILQTPCERFDRALAELFRGYRQRYARLLPISVAVG